MSNVGKDFKVGDIIDYCGDLYEVASNHGTSGQVWELTKEHKRTGHLVVSFYWSAYGEDCKLVKRA